VFSSKRISIRRKVRGPYPCFAFLSLDANRRWVGEFAHISTCAFSTLLAIEKIDSRVLDGAATRPILDIPAAVLREREVRIEPDLLPGNPFRKAPPFLIPLLDADPEPPVPPDCSIAHSFVESRQDFVFFLPG